MLNRIPLFIRKAARGWLTARPVVKPDLCIGCGHCREICPAKAIKIIEKKVEFDYERCIRCYCCHEVCPQKAIKLKSGLLVNVLKKALRLQ